MPESCRAPPEALHACHIRGCNIATTVQILDRLREPTDTVDLRGSGFARDWCAKTGLTGSLHELALTIHRVVLSEVHFSSCVPALLYSPCPWALGASHTRCRRRLPRYLQAVSCAGDPRKGIGNALYACAPHVRAMANRNGSVHSSQWAGSRTASSLTRGPGGGTGVYIFLSAQQFVTMSDMNHPRPVVCVCGTGPHVKHQMHASCLGGDYWLWLAGFAKATRRALCHQIET